MIQGTDEEQASLRVTMNVVVPGETTMVQHERASTRWVPVRNQRSLAVVRTLPRGGNVDRAHRRLRAPLARLERGEPGPSEGAVSPVELGAARLSLSQALWREGGDPVRTMTLARLARDGLAAGGAATQALHREAEAWILCLCLDVRGRLDGAPSR